GAGQGHLDEARHFLQFFFLDPAVRVEILDFAGDTAVEAGGVKACDAGDAAHTGDEILPAFFGADAESADQADTGYDDAASHGLTHRVLDAGTRDTRPGFCQGAVELSSSHSLRMTTVGLAAQSPSRPRRSAAAAVAGR